MKPKKAKRGFLFAAACLFAITAGVYEWFLSGRLSSPPASVSIDAIITRTLGAVAAACLLPIFGYRIFGRPTLKSLLAVIPCFVAVVCNPPLIGLFAGDATITYDAPSYFILFALECLATGMFEELLFRGMLFPAILENRRSSSKKIFLSVIISSAVFALAHLFNIFTSSPAAIFMQIGYSFLIGGMCSFALMKTGNVLTCVLLHATFNFTGTLVERLGSGGWGGLITLAIVLPVAAATAVYVVYSLVKIRPEKTNKLYE